MSVNELESPAIENEDGVALDFPADKASGAAVKTADISVSLGTLIRALSGETIDLTEYGRTGTIDYVEGGSHADVLDFARSTSWTNQLAHMMRENWDELKLKDAADIKKDFGPAVVYVVDVRGYSKAMQSLPTDKQTEFFENILSALQSNLGDESHFSPQKLAGDMFAVVQRVHSAEDLEGVLPKIRNLTDLKISLGYEEGSVEAKAFEEMDPSRFKDGKCSVKVGCDIVRPGELSLGAHVTRDEHAVAYTVFGGNGFQRVNELEEKASVGQPQMGELLKKALSGDFGFDFPAQDYSDAELDKWFNALPDGERELFLTLLIKTVYSREGLDRLKDPLVQVLMRERGKIQDVLFVQEEVNKMSPTMGVVSLADDSFENAMKVSAIVADFMVEYPGEDIAKVDAGRVLIPSRRSQKDNEAFYWGLYLHLLDELGQDQFNLSVDSADASVPVEYSSIGSAEGDDSGPAVVSSCVNGKTFEMGTFVMGRHYAIATHPSYELKKRLIGKKNIESQYLAVHARDLKGRRELTEVLGRRELLGIEAELKAVDELLAEGRWVHLKPSVPDFRYLAAGRTEMMQRFAGGNHLELKASLESQGGFGTSAFERHYSGVLESRGESAVQIYPEKGSEAPVALALYRYLTAQVGEPDVDRVSDEVFGERVGNFTRLNPLVNPSTVQNILLDADSLTALDHEYLPPLLAVMGSQFRLVSTVLLPDERVDSVAFMEKSTEVLLDAMMQNFTSVNLILPSVMRQQLRQILTNNWGQFRGRARTPRLADDLAACVRADGQPLHRLKEVHPEKNQITIDFDALGSQEGAELAKLNSELPNVGGQRTMVYVLASSPFPLSEDELKRLSPAEAFDDNLKSLLLKGVVVRLADGNYKFKNASLRGSVRDDILVGDHSQLDSQILSFCREKLKAIAFSEGEVPYDQILNIHAYYDMLLTLKSADPREQVVVAHALVDAYRDKGMFKSAVLISDSVRHFLPALKPYSEEQYELANVSARTLLEHGDSEQVAFAQTLIEEGSAECELEDDHLILRDCMADLAEIARMPAEADLDKELKAQKVLIAYRKLEAIRNGGGVDVDSAYALAIDGTMYFLGFQYSRLKGMQGLQNEGMVDFLVRFPRSSSDFERMEGSEYAIQLALNYSSATYSLFNRYTDKVSAARDVAARARIKVERESGLKSKTGLNVLQVSVYARMYPLLHALKRVKFYEVLSASGIDAASDHLLDKHDEVESFIPRKNSISEQPDVLMKDAVVDLWKDISHSLNISAGLGNSVMRLKSLVTLGDFVEMLGVLSMAGHDWANGLLPTAVAEFDRLYPELLDRAPGEAKHKSTRDLILSACAYEEDSGELAQIVSIVA